jgi:hypothetical protein
LDKESRTVDKRWSSSLGVGRGIGGWVDPTGGLDDVEKIKFLTLPGLELRTLGRTASRYTDWAIPAPYCGYGANKSYWQIYSDQYTILKISVKIRPIEILCT